MLKTLVIGATNIDMFVHTDSDYLLHDSNPAKIQTAFGGVACNVAVNLALLGNCISFITAIGGDTYGVLAENYLRDFGINIDESLRLEDGSSSVYLGIMDRENDLFLGVNDMQICKSLEVAFFEKKADFIRNFDILVIDNNLEYDALEYLLKTYRRKQIVVDAVSAKKVGKLGNLLEYITLLKLNRIELIELSNRETTEQKIAELLERGLAQALVTNSAEEIIYKSKDEFFTAMPIVEQKIANASGAGDAFLSGFTHGIIHHRKVGDCLEIAKKTASLTLQSTNSINTEIKKMRF